MVQTIELDNDNNLTAINVNDGKYGTYMVYIQLGKVTVIPTFDQNTTVYVNDQAEEIKGVVIGDH
jgi:topoisomerase IA-like protein